LAVAEKFREATLRRMVFRTGKFLHKPTLRHSPIAARGLARREFLRCQRTICLSLTTMRLAASVQKIAAGNDSVKRQMVQGELVFQPLVATRDIFSMGLIGIELVERSTVHEAWVA
jgi:hypothetical protein